jgi:hypothetical protein
VSACHENGCFGGICNSGKADEDRKKRIGIVSKHAHHIFGVNPDLFHFLPSPISSFLPYCIAGWDQIPSLSYQIGRRLKIAHSPTDRTAKGSHYILPALERLARKYPIEVLLVENKPHLEALELYKQADLVIDQVLTGWYGGFAVEAMKMGKPVAVFIRKEDLIFVPEKMARDLSDAVINIERSNMETVLEEYLENPGLLALKSEAGRAYVHRWHDPVYVAGITKSVYEA